MGFSLSQVSSTDTGDRAARSNSVSRISIPWRDSAALGRVEAETISVFMVAAGQTMSAIRTRATRMDAQGRRNTARAHHLEKRPSWATCSLITGIESTRRPRTDSRAGMKVTEAATEKNTTNAPAAPIDRRPVEGKNTSPSTATITAAPL